MTTWAIIETDGPTPARGRVLGFDAVSTWYLAPAGYYEAYPYGWAGETVETPLVAGAIKRLAWLPLDPAASGDSGIVALHLRVERYEVILEVVLQPDGGIPRRVWDDHEFGLVREAVLALWGRQFGLADDIIAPGAGYLPARFDQFLRAVCARCGVAVR